jgi:hypothetical protein
VWVKISSTATQQGALTWGNVPSTLVCCIFPVLIAPKCGFYTVWSGSGDTYIQGDQLSVNQWHLLVGTSNGTNIYFYQDAVYKGTAAFSFAASAKTNSYIRIGGYDKASSAINGQCVDARIYHRTLSQSEITTIYNAYPRGSDGITAGLVGRWLGGSAQTGATLANGTRIPDLSGNNNHGYATNGVTSAASIIGNRRLK